MIDNLTRNDSCRHITFHRIARILGGRELFIRLAYYCLGAWITALFIGHHPVLLFGGMICWLVCLLIYALSA